MKTGKVCFILLFGVCFPLFSSSSSFFCRCSLSPFLFNCVLCSMETWAPSNILPPLESHCMPPPTVVVVVFLLLWPCLKGSLQETITQRGLNLHTLWIEEKNKEKEGIHCFNWLQLFLLGPSWMNSLWDQMILWRCMWSEPATHSCAYAYHLWRWLEINIRTNDRRPSSHIQVQTTIKRAGVVRKERKYTWYVMFSQ